MVYVVQEQSNKNILPAKDYGDIKILLPPGMQVTFSAGQVTSELMRGLVKYNDEDYLLLIGDPVAIGIAVAAAANHNQGRVKMLKWDRQEKQYFPISINLYQKGENNNGEKENIFTK
ncbi:hypothetical protein KAR91_48975 [Candidatus Pacearchaeota archaeon]|nr:hypothetical protein [Candidatus Pacearchaeota archaeon]